VSELKIKAANHWMEQTLSTRKVEKSITPTILIMQRLHQDDPTGHILSKKRKNVFHICMPGEIKRYGQYVRPIELVMNYKNGLLDPVRLSQSVLSDMEVDLGQYGYAGQVGQNPTPPGGGMFKVDNFSVLDNLPTPANVGTTVRYWDKAGSKDSGAFTCGVKMARLRTGKVVVIDVKRGRWASDEREQIILQVAEADGPNVVIYHEQEPGSGGKDSAQSTIRNLMGFANYADRPTGDKVHRADPYSVQVNNGNILLLRGEWNAKFVEEHRFFPFGRYKDQVDAASGAFTKLVAKKLVQRVV
jgi:predicted phage terminase large subunit-like protein